MKIILVGIGEKEHQKSFDLLSDCKLQLSVSL